MPKEYKDGDRRYEILPPEERSRPPAETRAGVPSRYDFSGVETGWLARRRGRALGRALVEQAEGLKIAKRYVEAETSFEIARQELALAVARRQHLPLVLEAETLRYRAEIEKGRGELQAAADLYADHRARRAERRQLEAETHALEMAHRRRLILEEEALIKQIEDRLAQKNGESERRHQDPDPLGDFVRTESEVRRARSTAARVVEAIRAAAAQAGRDLTPQEIDLIDMYEGAAAAAEDQIRRGDAADF